MKSPKKKSSLKHILLICLTASFTLTFAQKTVDKNQWVLEKQKNPDLSFSEMSEIFDQGWEGKEYVKGHGWKQFNRLRHYAKSRMDSTGNIPNPYTYETAYKQFLADKSTASQQGNWSPMGPTQWTIGNSGYNPGIGRINAVTVSPSNPNTVYVAAASGGLWKSTNGGNTWNTTTDDFLVLGTSDIAIDPINDSIVYLATGDRDGSDTWGIGVLKSIDGGQTWNPTSLGNALPSSAYIVNKLLHHPDSSGILIAATNNGVYKTTDGGINWSYSFGAAMKDLAYQPNNPSVVYASNDGFYKSTDGGNSFAPVFTGLPSSTGRVVIDVTADDSNYVYALVSNSLSEFDGIYQSIDAGDTWAQMVLDTSLNILGYAQDGSDNSSQAWYDLAIAVDPNDKNHIFTGGVNVWESFDGGQNLTISSHWVYINNPSVYSHADIHSLDFYGNDLYCGSDGGVFKYTGSTSAWSDLSSGLNIAQVYRMGGYAPDENIIVSGHQDNGTNLYNFGQWSHIYGADGMEALIDHSNFNTVYGTFQYGGLMKSTDFGVNMSRVFNADDYLDDAGWVTPYAMNPQNNQELVIGCREIYKTTDGGSNWSVITTNLSGNPIDVLTYAPSDGNHIYGADWKNLFSSHDGGTNWNTKFLALPFTEITDIEVDANNPLNVYATLGGSNNGYKIVVSTDGGVSFTNISGDLPNIPVNTLILDKDVPGAIYVGMDIGIYYTDSTMLGNWIPFETNLPNVIVNELEINYIGHKIRAATYGRGIWESLLYSQLVGVEHQKQLENIHIYPNPTKGKLVIELENKLADQIEKITILNVAGVGVKQLEKSAITQQINLDLSAFESGIYFIKIYTKDEMFTQKLSLIK